MAAQNPTPGERNLGMELVRVTEAAALAAARWMGRGEKESADQAAVDAMRLMISTVSMDGVVVIGEGEKDEAPMLFNGERVGTGEPPVVDVAVDPIDGTTLTSRGQPGALSVIAVAEGGSMFNPGPCVYMEKIAVGPEAAGAVDLDASIAENIKRVADARGADPDDITVVVLDRDRHQEIIKQVRETGARIKLISDGDIAAAISAAKPGTGVDMLIGIGGTPEGVTAAAAIKCLGGEIQGRLWPRNDTERKVAIDMGYDLTKILSTDDLVAGDCFFAATGITDGELLQGVRYRADGATTSSIVMRSRSGTIRMMTAEHNLKKLMRFSRIDYDSSSLTLLVDASSLIYRAFFSTPESVKSPSGTQVNAAHGFINMLARLVADRNPDYLACATDEDWRPQWRVDLIPSYKTHRTEGERTDQAADAEDQLEVQIPIIFELLEVVRFPVAGCQDYEAEDVIGALAHLSAGRVEIVSGDRDLFQLIRDPDVCVLYPRRGVTDPIRADESYIEKKYEIPGRAYGDFAILRGDPSDGLPGVRGIGDKTAAQLIRQFGSLEKVIEAAITGDGSGPLGKVKGSLEYLDRAVKVVLISPAEVPLGRVDMTRPRDEPDESLWPLATSYGLDGPVRRLVSALRGL